MSGPRIRIRIRRKCHPGPDGTPREVLHGIDLQIGRHEVVCLFGPSGCGKTTLLQIVAGLDRDFDGTVEGTEGRTGYVFQSPRLLPWLSVRDNLLLVSDDAAAVEAVIATTGLAAHRDHFPGQLSGGLARRVALARAMVIGPELLLLDEPFASLDRAGADELRAELAAQLDRRPVTSLFVTHDLREAALLADRVVFLTPSPGTVRAELRLETPRAGRSDPGWLDATLARLQAV